MSLVKEYILEQVSQRNLSPDRAMGLLQELGELEKGQTRLLEESEIQALEDFTKES